MVLVGMAQGIVKFFKPEKGGVRSRCRICLTG